MEQEKNSLEEILKKLEEIQKKQEKFEALLSNLSFQLTIAIKNFQRIQYRLYEMVPNKRKYVKKDGIEVLLDEKEEENHETQDEPLQTVETVETPIEKEEQKEETLIEKKNRLLSINATIPSNLSDLDTFKVTKKGEKENTVKTVGITQVVLDNTDKPVVGTVKIINKQTNTEAKSIKINNTGRWNCALPVGEYTLNIVGIGGFNYSMDFNVPDLDSVLELPRPNYYIPKKKK